MEDFRVMFWPFSIPIVAIIGAFVYAIVATIARNRVRELEVRERIAMIERGMVPPPEVDPRGFDRAMGRIERHEYRRGYGRHRRAGITIMGVGFGLMVMIAFAGGGALETIIPGVTGEFFREPTVESLTSIVRAFDENKFDSMVIRKYAEKFGTEVFKEKLHSLIVT